ncbi:MAG: hypothetical protein RBR66_00660 [Candidatus Izemoplasmatales bacterium]|jgi:hypothetical protein|nr:hypothetical protein [Candidatus Izemoplasmatales bacterium]
MRVLVRILYAMLATGFFLLALVMAEQAYFKPYADSLTDEASELPEFYYFYTSIPNYHKSEPIIKINENGYQIYGYEVALAKINDDNELEMFEAVYLVVYSDTQDLSTISNLELNNTTTDSFEEIRLVKLGNIRLFNGVNEENVVYIPKDLFLSDSFDKILLKDTEGNTIIESALTIDETDFTIKENIEAFFSDFGRLPIREDMDDFHTENIYMQVNHPSRLKSYLIYLVPYFTILIVATFLIFFKRKRYE